MHSKVYPRALRCEPSFEGKKAHTFKARLSHRANDELVKDEDADCNATEN